MYVSMGQKRGNVWFIDWKRGRKGWNLLEPIWACLWNRGEVIQSRIQERIPFPFPPSWRDAHFPWQVYSLSVSVCRCSYNFKRVLVWLASLLRSIQIAVTLNLQGLPEASEMTETLAEPELKMLLLDQLLAENQTLRGCDTVVLARNLPCPCWWNKDMPCIFRENTLHTLKQCQFKTFIGSSRLLVTELVSVMQSDSLPEMSKVEWWGGAIKIVPYLINVHEHWMLL